MRAGNLFERVQLKVRRKHLVYWLVSAAVVRVVARFAVKPPPANQFVALVLFVRKVRKRPLAVFAVRVVAGRYGQRRDVTRRVANDVSDKVRRTSKKVGVVVHSLVALPFVRVAWVVFKDNKNALKRTK